MSDNHLLEVTKENGEFLFFYCDKYNTYSLYRTEPNNTLYLVTTDKGLGIERAEVLEVPSDFFLNTGVRFFKPIVEDGGVKFTGFTEIKGKGYRFTMSGDLCSLVESDLNADEIFSSAHNLLPVLDKFEIKHDIQRVGKLYFVGTDKSTEDEHPVFGIVDLLSGKLEHIYYLYSDLGEVAPSCVSIDDHDRNVYVTGKTVIFDESNKAINSVPYIEKFFYRK